MSASERWDEVAVAPRWQDKFPNIRPAGEIGRRVLKLWKDYTSACWSFRASNWLLRAHAHPKLRRWQGRFSCDLSRAWLSKSLDHWHVLTLDRPEQFVGFYHYLHFFETSDSSRFEEQAELAWNVWSELSRAPSSTDVPDDLGTTVPLPTDLVNHPNGGKLLRDPGYWSYLDECMRHAMGLLHLSDGHLSERSSSSSKPSSCDLTNKNQEYRSVANTCESLNRIWGVSLTPEPILRRLKSGSPVELKPLETPSPMKVEPVSPAKTEPNPEEICRLAMNWDESGRSLEKLLRKWDRANPKLEPVLVSSDAWKITSLEPAVESIRVLCEFDLSEYVDQDQMDEDAVWRCWVELSLLLPNPDWSSHLVDRGFDVHKALKFVASNHQCSMWVDYERFEAAVEDARGEGAPELTDKQLEEVYDRWLEHLPARPINLSSCEP
jgi:hypothetical protein